MSEREAARAESIIRAAARMGDDPGEIFDLLLSAGMACEITSAGSRTIVRVEITPKKWQTYSVIGDTVSPLLTRESN